MNGLLFCDSLDGQANPVFQEEMRAVMFNFSLFTCFLFIIRFTFAFGSDLLTTLTAGNL